MKTVGHFRFMILHRVAVGFRTVLDPNQPEREKQKRKGQKSGLQNKSLTNENIVHRTIVAAHVWKWAMSSDHEKNLPQIE